MCERDRQGERRAENLDCVCALELLSLPVCLSVFLGPIVMRVVTETLEASSSVKSGGSLMLSTATCATCTFFMKSALTLCSMAIQSHWLT